MNGGQTLRVTDFQTVAVTFENWASSFGLSGDDAALTADPNHNGLANLLEYALGLNPTAIGGSRGTSSGVVEENGVKYQSLSLTRPTGSATRTDIIYTPERASNLVPGNWSSSVNDIITLGSVPGPGNLETATVRSPHPISATPREFLRLKVTLQ